MIWLRLNINGSLPADEYGESAFPANGDALIIVTSFKNPNIGDNYSISKYMQVNSDCKIPSNPCT